MEFPSDLSIELQQALYAEYGASVSLEDAKEIGGALMELYSLILNLHE